ncbi:hypothetical protein GGP41_010738 [Bipolaris sorokiniana]|uniref:Uncharacterized protein n=1 Tax=Cochliobolus sativus TaxID=45130 RepID=A0A8H5ZN04_COCSA|nr:hypothetical protein GGP41_010738 [Bipolaris sorokiniana]
MMLALKLVLVAATSALGVALPEPTPAALLNAPPVNCGKVNNALSVLKKLGPPATSFCRSYIKAPATSTTVTITTAPTVTSTTSTTTVTVTSAQCPGQKRDVAAAHADYEIERSEEASWVVQKRTNILPQLQLFAAAKVSEACSCLCLKPTATATLTSTAPAPLAWLSNQFANLLGLVLRAHQAVTAVQDAVEPRSEPALAATHPTDTAI